MCSPDKVRKKVLKIDFNQGRRAGRSHASNLRFRDQFCNISHKRRMMRSHCRADLPLGLYPRAMSPELCKDIPGLSRHPSWFNCKASMPWILCSYLKEWGGPVRRPLRKRSWHQNSNSPFSSCKINHAKIRQGACWGLSDAGEAAQRAKSLNSRVRMWVWNSQDLAKARHRVAAVLNLPVVTLLGAE